MCFLYIQSADAKLYSCYDHYSVAYCDRSSPKIDVKVVSDSTIVTNLSTNVTRESIDAIKDNKIELDKELTSLKNNLVLKDAAILSFESAVNMADYEQSQKKELYRKEPKEETRLGLVDADVKLSNSKVNLDNARKERAEIISKIGIVTNSIEQLKKGLVQSQRDLSIFKKTPSATLQTIVIYISKPCVILIKNNLKTSCPSYADLMALNIDTSRKESGAFSLYDGYYHRGKPLVKNDDKLYNVKDFNIIIDGSSALADRVKTITITPNLNTFVRAENMTKLDNSRVVHRDRYVDSCKDATINASTWLYTIGDTINYLRSGCQNTLLKTFDIINDTATITKIDTSNKWKHDQWVKDAKEKYKKSYIGSKENGTNKSIIEDEDQ